VEAGGTTKESRRTAQERRRKIEAETREG